MESFKIQKFSEYLKETKVDIENGKIVDYSISTMNLFARPNSLIEKFLNTLLEKGFKVYYDKTLTERTYVLPDGHYVFKILPRGKKKNKFKDSSDKISAKTKKKYADILVDLEQRFFQIKTSSNVLKKMGSLHLLQFLGTSHLKIAPTIFKNGAKSVTIATGELSSESSQNNLALTLESDKAYGFAKKILDPKYDVGKNMYETCKVSKRLSLVADYGNFGDPLVLPKIHQLAQEFITDKPKNVLLISQYNPSGRILKALNKAAESGANVTIPLEPADDYRRHDGGFKFLFAKFKAVVNKKINLPTRPQPSHVKCLIVQHSDDSLSMIYGSDNFDSWADTFYRNTEIATVIRRVSKVDSEYKMIQNMLDILTETKEITKDERRLYR